MRIKVIKKNERLLSIGQSFLREIINVPFVIFYLMSHFVVFYYSYHYGLNNSSYIIADKIISNQIPLLVVLNTIMAILFLLSFIIDNLAILFNRRKRAIHDVICGSFVVKTSK
jgi:uncharacterized RDD family membrane protein YckC